MFLSVEKKQGIYDEIQNSKDIDHPFISKIIDDFVDSEGR
jgi:hypothetical protein